VKVLHSTTSEDEKHTDRELAHKWKTIDWNQTRTQVNRLQTRIAKATREEKWNLVKRLQYLLTHSYFAKILAIRKVTQNTCIRPPKSDPVGSRKIDPVPAIIVRSVIKRSIVYRCL